MPEAPHSLHNDSEAFLRNAVLNTSNENFIETALSVFRFQYNNNDIYKSYCNLLRINPDTITLLENIPVLPIQFFKTKEIKTTAFKETLYFESSGTTGLVNSRHYVKEIKLYEESFLKSFRQYYGAETKYCIIGLLPSYLERKHSSLVHMVQDIIDKSGSQKKGF